MELLILMFSGVASGRETQRPNIIVIVSDDQGYADVGFQGRRQDVLTPNLDALAQSGVICKRGYVTAPVCSPSRAALMTGRYQQRFGHHNNIVAEAAKPYAHMPMSEVTLAQELVKAGYKTALIGKWHLGLHDRTRPYERGFTDFYGIITGGHDYYENNPDQRAGADNDYKARIERNGQGEKFNNYLTDVFGDEAVRVVQENKNRPFFLYLAFNAPHTPTQAPENLIKEVPASVKQPNRRKYLAQIMAMDNAIGRVMQALKETGTDKNTFIVFFSDNGGAKFPYYDNTPLRDYKGSLYEGGVRVPFIASFPGHIPAGTLCDLPVTSLDVFATACNLAGVTPENHAILDSRDMLPVLSGMAKSPTHEALFWDFPSFGHAVCHGDYKLIIPRNSSPELYNLRSDESERTNLAATHPNELKKLSGLLSVWKTGNVRPLWGPESDKEKK